ncbi:MAG: hypothetical protein P8J78_03975 [Maricaulis sp.]|jgi:hypothetical protein|nr:hypothetical protein [Maricaulis sp.]
MLRLTTIVLLALSFNSISSAHAQNLAIASFNVESDRDTRAELVAEDFQRLPAMHVWALQEVTDQETLDLFVATVSEATGFQFAGHLGTTGGQYDDYLAIMYLEQAFTGVSFREMDEVGGGRHPLMMTATTWTGTTISFINNHFNRGDETTREGQARRLRDYIVDHADEAIIALGTFNFDYDHQGARRGGNSAFTAFGRGDNVGWIQPMCMYNDNCPATGSQCNPHYENFLDFIFVGGVAREWQSVSDLAFIGENYCRRDGDGYSDHRPVLGQLALPAAE